MVRRVPDISHLQFLALGALATEERAGRAVRTVLRSYGVRRSAAAFYQLMSRLERDGLVDGWYAPVDAGDQRVQERRYRITAAGRRALAATRAFYREAETLLRGDEVSNA